MSRRAGVIAAAIALALGAGAVVLQWMWAAPVTNGWFCTGRLACWVWTRANLPAYLVGDVLGGGETEEFWPIAAGIFLQWLALAFLLAWAASAILQATRKST